MIDVVNDVENCFSTEYIEPRNLNCACSCNDYRQENSSLDGNYPVNGLECLVGITDATKGGRSHKQRSLLRNKYSPAHVCWWYCSYNSVIICVHVVYLLLLMQTLPPIVRLGTSGMPHL
jgi:hypothetical protein